MQPTNRPNQTVGLGDTPAPSLRGGVDAEQPPGDLTAAERERYARHLLLPGVGRGGQERLRGARVLVVGAGGLGAPVLTYLAAAGVGTIGIVDDDVVDLSNLQRQVIHGTGELGMPKVESAAARIAAINPHVHVERHGVRLTAAEAPRLLSPYDVVVDATDNFATRYLLSDACVLLGRPLVWGAVSRFDGQVSVWWPGRGPCYRCVFPTPPAPGLVPSCAEGGVLGVLPGVIGSLQATEVLKIVLGIGEPLVGRMLVYDALAGSMGEIRLARRPDCAVCGDDAGPVTLVDLDEPACAVPRAEESTGVDPAVGDAVTGGAVTGGAVTGGAAAMTGRELPWEVDPLGARDWLAGPDAPVLLDVREAAERDIVCLTAREEAWVPLGALRARPVVPGVDPGRPVLVYCRSGVRSAEAVARLRAAGYDGAVNLAGGVLGWRRDLDPGLPAY